MLPTASAQIAPISNLPPVQWNNKIKINPTQQINEQPCTSIRFTLPRFVCQAMNVDGDLVGDFVFESGLGSRVLHCRNAPSPGATSSLAIGRMMADRAAEEFGLPKRRNAELY